MRITIDADAREGKVTLVINEKEIDDDASRELDEHEDDESLVPESVLVNTLFTNDVGSVTYVHEPRSGHFGVCMDVSKWARLLGVLREIEHPFALEMRDNIARSINMIRVRNGASPLPIREILEWH